MQNSETLIIKTITIGESAVGKSSILIRFSHDKFDKSTQPTTSLSLENLAKNYTIPGDNRVIRFHLWDTAGQQRYRSLSSIYYKQAKIALCVYDITNLDSFEKMKLWVKELKEKGPKDVVVAMVGNKIDRIAEIEVPEQMAQQYANEIGALFMLVSAKEDKNITDLFTILADQLLNPGKGCAKTGWLKKTSEQQNSTNQVKIPSFKESKHELKQQKDQIAQRNQPQKKQNSVIREKDHSQQFFQQLSQLNLSKDTIDVFRNQAINSWQILNSMTKQDLLFLKIKFGDVTRILSAIKK